MKKNDWFLKTDEGNFIPATAENIISMIEGDGKPTTPKTDTENKETEERYARMGIKVKCYYEDGHNVTEFL